MSVGITILCEVPIYFGRKIQIFREITPEIEAFILPKLVVCIYQTTRRHVLPPPQKKKKHHLMSKRIDSRYDDVFFFCQGSTVFVILHFLC